MAHLHCILTYILCFVSIIFIIHDVTNATPGRVRFGGGRRLTQTRVKPKMTRVKPKLTSVSRPRRMLSGAGWKGALIAGVAVYGASMYMGRRRYRMGYRPTECVNMYDTDDNMTIYKQFICPRHYQSDAYIYCCGEDLRQKCCTRTMRYGKGHGSGSIAGIVVGVLVAMAIVGVTCFCCYRKYKKSNDDSKRDYDIQMSPVATVSANQMPPMPSGPYGDQGYAPVPTQIPPGPLYAPPVQQYGPPGQPYPPPVQPYGPPGQPYGPSGQPYGPPGQPYAPPGEPYAPPGQVPPYGAPGPYGQPLAYGQPQTFDGQPYPPQPPYPPSGGVAY